MDNVIYKQVTSSTELSGAFAVRREVFICEQNIAEDEEYDGLDNTCIQFIARNNNGVVGTARVRFISPDCVKIERMAVLKDYRRQGIGTGILVCIEEEFERGPVTEAILHAQMAAIPFYKACGFLEVGATLFEADIEHIKMQKRLVSSV